MNRLVVVGLGCLALVAGLLLVSSGALEGQVKKAKVPKAIETLKNSKENKARITAADGLGDLGQIQSRAVADAVPVFIDIVKNDKEDAELRRACALALGKTTLQADKGVPVLRAVMVNDKESINLRTAAATALGYYGNEAKAALDDLRKVSNENKGKDKPKGEQALAKAAGGAAQAVGGGKK